MTKTKPSFSEELDKLLERHKDAFDIAYDETEEQYKDQILIGEFQFQKIVNKRAVEVAAEAKQAILDLFSREVIGENYTKAQYDALDPDNAFTVFKINEMTAADELRASQRQILTNDDKGEDYE